VLPFSASIRNNLIRYTKKTQDCVQQSKFSEEHRTLDMITGIVIKCRERFEVYRGKNLNSGRGAKVIPIFWRQFDDSIRII